MDMLDMSTKFKTSNYETVRLFLISWKESFPNMYFMLVKTYLNTEIYSTRRNILN